MNVRGAPILRFNDWMTPRTITHVPKATVGDRLATGLSGDGLSEDSMIEYPRARSRRRSSDKWFSSRTRVPRLWDRTSAAARAASLDWTAAMISKCSVRACARDSAVRTSSQRVRLSRVSAPFIAAAKNLLRDNREGATWKSPPSRSPVSSFSFPGMTQ